LPKYSIRLSQIGGKFMKEIKRVQFCTKVEVRGEELGSLGARNNFFVGDFNPKLKIEKIECECENEIVKIYIKNRKDETVEMHEYHGIPFKLVY
jgi:hypothetical protein